MKNLKLILTATLLAVSFVIAQEDAQAEDKIPVIHDYESLRAFEYDADSAESRDAEALDEYLRGNILIGIWRDSNTRQYFAPSGTTWYQEEDMPQSHGTWRVRDDGKYCSVWQPSRVESCYTVSFIDDVLFWHSGKHRYPSAIQVLKKEEDSEEIEAEDTELEDTELEDTGDDSN